MTRGPKLQEIWNRLPEERKRRIASLAGDLRSELAINAEPVAFDVGFDDDCFIIRLTDGRLVTVPLEWYPRLYHASQYECCHLFP